MPVYHYPSELLDEAGVAYMLSVPLRDVRRLVQTGRIPVSREFGGRMRWHRAEIQAVLSRMFDLDVGGKLLAARSAAAQAALDGWGTASRGRPCKTSGRQGSVRRNTSA